MKRVLFFVALAAVSLNAAAQTWQDAYAFSENNYSGTARSVGMGNAMTAVGGDLGSLTFNPAGSAVSSCSQFILTPGISVSSMYAYAADRGGFDASGYGTPQRESLTRFKMPNFGFSVNMDTGRSYGLKRISFGLVGNATNDYTGKYGLAGVNNQTSLASAMATEATGYAHSIFDASNPYGLDNIPSWRTMNGYFSGMYDLIDGSDSDYLAVTERLQDNGDILFAAPINQQFGRKTLGNKYDLLLNFAANVSDVFYFGANLGISTLTYRADEFWIESAVNPEDFPLSYSDGTTLYFNQLHQLYSYRADGTGIYAKAGFIWRPVTGLRVGAAIQTPTVYQIGERYGYEGKTDLSGTSYSDSSPEDEWHYKLRSPYRVNAGLAYTFGSLGLVSVDYELCDYSRMKFSNDYGYYSYDEVSDLGVFPRESNADIKEIMGMSHTLRIGAEVKPIPELAVRAGYNFISDPQKYYFDGDDSLVFSRQNVSLGLGYNSGGSFFADLAVRVGFLPDEAGSLYEDYIQSVASPRFTVDSSFLVDALLTLGWRF